MNSSSSAAATELPLPVAMADMDEQAREVVESALGVARERLGMEIGWLAEFRDDRKVFRVVEGDREEWGLHDHDSVPLADSYCRRMYAGEIPNAIPDTSRQPEVAHLDITQRLRISAYIGVPLVLPGGQLRGAFCCARHTPHRTLDDRDVRFMQVLARLVADELAFREARREKERLERQIVATEALVVALEARDYYTASHSARVVDLARCVAQRLGLDGTRLQDVEHVALLHDVGKVGIPDSILRKAGPLTDDEWAVMREHPVMGAEIVGGLPALEHLAPAIRAEHERWDGRGYPDGLAGDAIPVESRITFVCDGFHAMVSDRPYRKAMSHDAAVAELRACSGSMFWPDAVDVLLAELDGDSSRA